MRPRITVYLTDAQLEYLRREAGKRRRSLSSYVTQCLLDYHVEPTNSQNGSVQTSPPFSALLHDTEERIAGEVQRRTSTASTQVAKQIMVLSAMLDRFVLSTLVHTPEVSEPNRAKAITSGDRRYRNWRESVKEILDQIGAPRPDAWLKDDHASEGQENAA